MSSTKIRKLILHTCYLPASPHLASLKISNLSQKCWKSQILIILIKFKFNFKKIIKHLNFLSAQCSPNEQNCQHIGRSVYMIRNHKWPFIVLELQWKFPRTFRIVHFVILLDFGAGIRSGSYAFLELSVSIVGLF